MTNCNTLPHTTTNCKTLQQHTATHCNTLQHTATIYCNNPPARYCTILLCGERTVAYADVMQLEPVFVRDTLQHTATHCNNTLHHTAPHCTTVLCGEHNVVYAEIMRLEQVCAGMARICRSHYTYMKEDTYMKESCHTYEGVMSHV